MLLLKFESNLRKRMLLKYTSDTYNYNNVIINQLINPLIKTHSKVEYQEIMIYHSVESTVTSSYPRQMLKPIIKFLFEKQIERKNPLFPFLTSFFFQNIIMKKEKEKEIVYKIINSIYEENENKKNDDIEEEISKTFFNESFYENLDGNEGFTFQMHDNKQNNIQNIKKNLKKQSSIECLTKLVKKIDKNEKKCNIGEKQKEITEEIKSPIFSEQKSNKSCIKLRAKKSSKMFFPKLYDPKKEYEVHVSKKNINNRNDNDFSSFRSLADFFLTNKSQIKKKKNDKKLISSELSKMIKRTNVHISLKKPIKNKTKIEHKKITMKKPISLIEPLYSPIIRSKNASFVISQIVLSETKKVDKKGFSFTRDKIPNFSCEKIKKAVYGSPFFSYSKSPKKKIFLVRCLGT